MSTDHARRRDILDATVNRSPVYPRVLRERTGAGVRAISSDVLAGPVGSPVAALRILVLRGLRSRSGARVDEMKELMA